MRALAAVVLLAPLSFGALMLFLDSYGQSDRARRADAIVVLGAAVNAHGVPGPSLSARTLHAVELYKQGLAPRILCTGGMGRHAPSEARAAALLAQRHGVPAAHLLLEEASTSTWQNIGNAARICRARDIRSVIVVSDPYHLWRARRNFAAHRLQAYPSPTPNRHRQLRLWMTAREAFSVLRDVLLLR